MLEIADVSVAFGGVRAVSSVDLALPAAAMLGLVGPNGSGKSTLLNAICGLVPRSGSVTMNSRRVRAADARSAHLAGIARTYQTPQLVASLSCLENVLLSDRNRRWTGAWSALLSGPMTGRSDRKRAVRAYESMERAGLRIAPGTATATLTHEQQRRLELARALNSDPQVLLLDEPGAGLNDVETASFAQTLLSLRSPALSMIIVDHKLEFLNEMCDTLVVLELGKVIAAGLPSAVWSDPVVVSAYLGTDDVVD